MPFLPLPAEQLWIRSRSPKCSLPTLFRDRDIATQAIIELLELERREVLSPPQSPGNPAELLPAESQTLLARYGRV